LDNIRRKISYSLHLLIRVGCFIYLPVDHSGWFAAKGILLSALMRRLHLPSSSGISTISRRISIITAAMTGEDEQVYKQYAPDFFDFIVIDECHRGGAKDESEWRRLLEHFEPTAQLGLTAKYTSLI